MSVHTDAQLRNRLTIDRFPRSAAYDPRWQIDNLMGPNVLWLTEFLCEAMDLRPGMRVLDLGCGKAVSSVFLAREYGVQVWATDLWIAASDNAARIAQAGLEHTIFPVHADARIELPFADGFFDAVVSMDAYQYFGTDDLYLPRLVRHLKGSGRIGIVVPGLEHEVDEMPASWDWDFCCFHTPAWWRRHWSITRLVDVEVADRLPDGHDLWLLWDEVCGYTRNAYMTEPGGDNLGFTRVVAART